MNDEVLAAISRAKWNESITIDIESEANNTENPSVLLLPSLDRENGGVKWEGFHTGNEDGMLSPSQAKSIHFQTKKWIFPMLNDDRRNKLYEKAIHRASLEVAKRFPTASVIQTLDIGSGTGLLAMLSETHLSNVLNTKSNTSKIQVTSLEMAGPMANLAKATVQLQQSKKDSVTTNSSSVQVIEGHSCKIPPMKDQDNKQTNTGALLCTSELLESGLLNEGWLPAMRDAWERHLHPNAVVVPQQARIIAQLVEGASGFCGPHQSLSFHNIATNEEATLRLLTTAPNSDETSTIGMLSDDGSYDPLTGQKLGIQVEIHANRYLTSEGGSQPILRVLSDPITALSVDVTSPESIPKADAVTSTQTTFVAKESGKADGILFWWELDLDEGNDMTYSTEPKSDFQDHWHQCLYVLPPSSETKGCGTVIHKDKEYSLVASHTDSRVHFSIRNKSDSTAKDTQQLINHIPATATPLASPFRCWQLNDVARSTKFCNGIRFALERLLKNEHTVGTNVLDISDFSLCGMMAALLGANMVTSIESSSSGLALETAKVAQIGNNLPKNNTIFQIVQCHAESLSKDVVSPPDQTEESATNKKRKRELVEENAGVVNLVVGEPYYEMLEGWSIETALNFFYTIRMLKRKEIVQSNALCVPARATVFACGIECPDVGRAYNKHLSCGTSDTRTQICGFDHTPVTECWNYENKGISLPLWEYNNVVPVTETVMVGMLDYESDNIVPGKLEERDSNTQILRASFTKANRTCHAIVFWVDYGIRNKISSSDDNDDFETVSTGFGAYASEESHPIRSRVSEKQTVRILAQPEPTILGESLVIPKHGLEL